MKVLIVAGARPNYAKLAPLTRAFTLQGIRYEWWDLPQHKHDVYEDLHDFGIAKPPIYTYGENRGSSAQMFRFLYDMSERMKDNKYTLVIVLGDITVASIAAQAAMYANIPVWHVEGGLRSANARVENHHRILVDHIAERNFSPNEKAQRNLEKEGLHGKMYGNIMHEQLAWQLRRTPIGKTPEVGYVFCTVHRAENCEPQARFAEIVQFAEQTAKLHGLRLIFPQHPRHPFSVLGQCSPFRPNAAARAIRDATLVLTDSGGVQDEALYLDKPTVILRSLSERGLGPRQFFWTEEKAAERALLSKSRDMEPPPEVTSWRIANDVCETGRPDPNAAGEEADAAPSFDFRQAIRDAMEQQQPKPDRPSIRLDGGVLVGEETQRWSGPCAP